MKSRDFKKISEALQPGNKEITAIVRYDLKKDTLRIPRGDQIERTKECM